MRFYDGWVQRAYQYSQTLWNPNFVVQMPIIPQSGMQIVTTFVTTNYISTTQRVWTSLYSGTLHAPSSSSRSSSVFESTRMPTCYDRGGKLMILAVRRSDSPERGCERLREAQVRVLEERELELVVLADAHERACSVQAL